MPGKTHLSSLHPKAIISPEAGLVRPRKLPNGTKRVWASWSRRERRLDTRDQSAALFAPVEWCSGHPSGSSFHELLEYRGA